MANCSTLWDRRRQMLSDSDDNLFEHILNNENHILHMLLPELSTDDYT